MSLKKILQALLVSSGLILISLFLEFNGIKLFNSSLFTGFGFLFLLITAFNEINLVGL
ncbi:MAG: hypothetical protein ABIA76_00940 [Candidatus Diapherotrites archaeon]